MKQVVDALELAARRRHVEQAEQALAGVDLQQQRVPATARQQPAQGGGQRALAHAALPGDHDQLQTGQPIEQVHDSPALPVNSSIER